MGTRARSERWSETRASPEAAQGRGTLEQAMVNSKRYAGVAAALLVGLAGCDGRASEARRLASEQLACPAASVTVRRTGPEATFEAQYLAEGCGRSELYACHDQVRHYGAVCTRVHPFRPAPSVHLVPVIGTGLPRARAIVLP